MAINDVLELTMNMSHVDGEKAAAVFHYRQTADAIGGPVAAALATFFGADVGQAIMNVADDSWTHDSTYVVNLDDPDDFAELVEAEPGALNQTALPTVLCVSFRSPRFEVGVNRAYKRLPLGNAEQIGGGGAIAAASLDDFYFVQQALGSALTSGGSSFTPVIIRKNYVDKVLVGYDIRASVAGQWQICRQLGTQKSRQQYDWTVADEPV